MCGIFFSIGFKNLPSAVIDSVSHRGPDGRGWNEFMSSNGPVLMAHRRLSIVDLSEDGHQPMASEDGRYWVTYNGEIYNYLEIRDELKGVGYHFKTQTDTEVLLKSYVHWGPECVHKFNGMFAFVIWDDHEKTFFAARDRFGVKPLYYYRQGNNIAFASEIKQFKHFTEWKSILNQELKNIFLKKGYCDHLPETLYQDVFQIQAGHYLQPDVLNKNINPICWYDLKNHIKPMTISDEEAVARFKFLFEDAIRLRLRSDVVVGACLSGGLDSSSIVSMMRSIEPNKEIHTFSAVFPGYDVDESIYINELTVEKELINHKNYPSFDIFLEKLDEILFYQDLPFPGTSIFAQWMTFESSKTADITVLLDGQGADESLLGYPGMLDSLIFDYAKKLKFFKILTFLRWQSTCNNQSIKNTIASALSQRFPKLYTLLLNIKGHNVLMEKDIPRTITEVCLNHFSNNLQSLLRYEDRNSMAFSRETRLPFLDYRLVEFILSLPVDKRFRKTKTKWVLRKAMEKLNVSSILKRRDKIGFATPEQLWLEKMNEGKAKMDFRTFVFKRWMNNENII